MEMAGRLDDLLNTLKEENNYFCEAKSSLETLSSRAVAIEN